mmetsp:Transcript_134080/g.428409  ORF Transcript_134080/g.428409 Transcript_134080/m.428409 type:complete len:223 (+) Transcript_134080:155-823(+)
MASAISPRTHRAIHVATRLVVHALRHVERRALQLTSHIHQWRIWRRRQLVPVCDRVHTMLLLELRPHGRRRAHGGLVLVAHGRDVRGQGGALVDVDAVPRRIDVVPQELLLQSPVRVQEKQLILPVQKAGGERNAELVLLHGEFEGNSTAEDLPHLLEHGRHIDPSAAPFVRAHALELTCVAPELREQQRLAETSEVVDDTLVGRIAKVRLPLVIQVLRITP